MAEGKDLEFTYSLIDRIFRFSLGELADFSGAKYDGDFSLSRSSGRKPLSGSCRSQPCVGAGTKQSRPWHGRRPANRCAAPLSSAAGGRCCAARL
jgi:hypothetical protein